MPGQYQRSPRGRRRYELHRRDCCRQRLLHEANAICSPQKRLLLDSAQRGDHRSPVTSQMISYLGPDVAAFASHFGDLGAVVTVVPRI